MPTASTAPASPATEAQVGTGVTGPSPRRSRRGNPLGALAGAIWLLIVVVPLYWVVVTSLRNLAGFFDANPLAPPTEPTLHNYRLVWEGGFVRYLVNSAIVTVAAVGLTLAVSVLAAYAIVRGTGRPVRLTFQFFLLGLAIPQQATIIPIYYLITRMRLYDSLTAIVLPSVAFAIPLTVLILVNFLRDVPVELFDAMRVDGAGDWRMLWSLVLPLARPAVVTVMVYDALQVWNGFLFPLILTQSPAQRVLPLSLWAFQGEFRVNTPAILAAVVLATLPILTLYVVGRRYLVSGLTAGFGR
ncbi:carbohydrate ABC transporter permease [Pseudonocardia acaciae]|uniref:carbohydrate ABC transporter permease n=1 Tax=Pseudonocardia acaciae TaxID=551276 RepID=UPI0009FE7F6E|nr:carbohydrate ABC transporter permease [Pseudonocardia acaciae]